MPTNANHKKAAFIEAFRCTGTVRGASRAADVSTRSHYRWLRDDAEYAAAFDEAGRFAAHHLVEAARQRAIEGVRRVRFDRSGQPLIDPDTGEPYVEYQYSDVLLIFLLKNLMPDRFGDKQHVTHAVEDWRSQLEAQGVDPDKALEQFRAALDEQNES